MLNKTENNPITVIDNMLNEGVDIWELAVSIAQDDESEMGLRRWRQGDVSSRIEKSYGENTLSKFAAAINVNTSTLRQRRNMATFYLPETRTMFPSLGYSHYRSALKLGDLDRALWALEKAENRNWPVFKFEMLLKRMLGKKTSLPIVLLDIRSCLESIDYSTGKLVFMVAPGADLALLEQWLQRDVRVKVYELSA